VAGAQSCRTLPSRFIGAPTNDNGRCAKAPPPRLRSQGAFADCWYVVGDLTCTRARAVAASVGGTGGGGVGAPTVGRVCGLSSNTWPLVYLAAGARASRSGKQQQAAAAVRSTCPASAGAPATGAPMVERAMSLKASSTGDKHEDGRAAGRARDAPRQRPVGLGAPDTAGDGGQQGAASL
jgi:hypothetical protein